MDRIDQWRIFVTVATEKSFAAAARRHGRSPQGITRAVAGLEERLGARLLYRTTRSVSLTDEGARYLERCQQVLAEVDRLEAPEDAVTEVQGILTLTAPILFGQMHVNPIVLAFTEQHPGVEARLMLHDRVVSLAGEGVDVAVRIGHLPDSSLKARLVGHVRTVVCGSPQYLKTHGTPETLDDLPEHQSISFTGRNPIPDSWSFRRPGRKERRVRMKPRLTVNMGQAAIDAAVAGAGLTRVLSYQVAELVKKKRLRIVLEAFEPAPVPVHLVQLPGWASRVAPEFVDFAAERLRARLKDI